MAGRYSDDRFSSTYQKLAQGRIWVVEDAAKLSEIEAEERDYYLQQHLVAWVGIPLVSDGELVAAMCVAQDRPRRWTPREVRLVEETAARLWSAVKWSRAERALRESEARTQRALDLLEGITEATEDHVVAIDPEYWFVAFNSSYQNTFEKIFGRRVEVGDCLVEALAHLPEEREKALDIWGRALDGERMVATMEFGNPRLERRFFDLRFGPIYDADGEVIAAAEFASDVTERVRQEQMLRETKEKLEEANRQKTEFLAMLSHELRNPLTPITFSLELLDRVEPGGDKAERARQAIARQVEQLSSLVDDLLEITRVNRGKVKLDKEGLDLGKVVDGCVDAHRGLLEGAGVELEVQTVGEAPVFGDCTRLVQVVGNLLQNAAKFTTPGDRVWVEVQREGDEALMVVEDTGMGMDEETLEVVFEPFAQAAQPLARKKGGLGIGLALVRELIELHGGSVSASSERPGKGARFEVRLPLDEGATPKAQPKRPEVTGEARQILIIEDNEEVAEFFRLFLELRDHEVVVAHDGEEGVDVARKLRPEVISCDVGLPVMNGYEVARERREDAPLRDTLLWR